LQRPTNIYNTVMAIFPTFPGVEITFSIDGADLKEYEPLDKSLSDEANVLTTYIEVAEPMTIESKMQYTMIRSCSLCKQKSIRCMKTLECNINVLASVCLSRLTHHFDEEHEMSDCIYCNRQCLLLCPWSISDHVSLALLHSCLCSSSNVALGSFSSSISLSSLVRFVTTAAFLSE